MLRIFCILYMVITFLVIPWLWSSSSCSDHDHVHLERTDGFQRSLVQKAESLRSLESRLSSSNIATISSTFLDEAETECRNVRELLTNINNIARLTGTVVNCFGLERSVERLENLIRSWQAVLDKEKRIDEMLDRHKKSTKEEMDKKSDEIQWWLEDQYVDEDEGEESSNDADWKTK